MKVLRHKIAVFSKGKPDKTFTAEWFKQHKFANAIYVVSDDDDVEQYKRSTNCHVVVAHGSFNLASKKQWALENLTTKRSPWLLGFEDNIQKVTCVVPEKYGLDRIDKPCHADFRSVVLSPQQVISKMNQDIKLAESVGAYYGGFASNENHFFRKKKYRTVAFVWGKMGYAKRSGPAWPDYLTEKDDYGFTAECLKFSGRVVVNNYLYAWSKRHENKGGSRSIEARAKDRRKAVQILLKKFPELFRPKTLKNSPEGTEIQLRFHSEKQVDEWRNVVN